MIIPRPPPRLPALPRALAIPLSLCLAATAFFLWCLVGSFGVRVGISLQELRLVADAADWQLQWPVLPQKITM